MKLPWDEKYIKICFHTVITFAAIYILSKLLDAVTFAFANLNIMFDGIGSTLGKISGVLSPLLTAIIIAYLLDPVIDFFQDKYEQICKKGFRVKTKEVNFSDKIKNLKFVKKICGSKYIQGILKRTGALKPRSKKSGKPEQEFKRRNAGVLLTLLALIATLVSSGILLFRVGSSTSISLDVVQIISRTVNDFNDNIFKIQTMLADFELIDYFSKYIDNFTNEVTVLAGEISNNVISGITSVGSGAMTFFLALVISIYFMRDKEKYLHTINDVMDTFIPGRINRILKNFFGDINAIFSDYIRGQLTDAVIMAILIGTLLRFLNIKFSAIIGIFSGIANLIPYFGAVIAFALSVLTALISGDPIKALYAAIGIIILQQIDGMFIIPRVVGAKVELSPVLVLLSLSIAGSLFGLVGMILAVPICAIIKLFLKRFMMRRKLKNELKITQDAV